MAHLARRTALTTAFAVALAVPLAACSTSNDATGTSTAAAKGDEGADAKTTVPDGYTTAQIPNSSVTFAVPSDWTTLTSDDADADDRIDAFAQATGADADSVKLKLTAYGVISAGRGGSGKADEINAQVNKDQNELRTKEEITAGMEEFGIGQDDVEVASTTTGSGAEARTVSYSLSFGGQTQYGAIINALVPKDGGTLVVTVTSYESAQRAQELLDAVAGSI
ncbi:hypothetical protein [Actinomyces sp.]|uniref:hypothetical protein n=1 Tax=Actinomyces sp. TaxID=29317 RepID=UPI0026DB7981|nr:hypothetical protein [Actinomyces sp.]MDO4901779.1 hypothetical protein [Actinomyces sp.]